MSRLAQPLSDNSFLSGLKSYIPPNGHNFYLVRFMHRFFGTLTQASSFFFDICSGPPLRPLSSCFSICQLAFRRCQFSCVGAFTLLYYISHHGIFLAWTIMLYSLLFLLQTMFSLWFGVTWNLKLVTFFFFGCVNWSVLAEMFSERRQCSTVWR